MLTKYLISIFAAILLIGTAESQTIADQITLTFFPR